MHFNTKGWSVTCLDLVRLITQKDTTWMKTRNNETAEVRKDRDSRRIYV